MGANGAEPVWIFQNREGKGIPYACFDHKNSVLQSWELQSTDPLVHPEHPAVLSVKGGFKAKTLGKFPLIPSGTSALLVKGEVLDILKSLPKDEVGFHPALIRCRDGDVNDFVVARPLVKIACTDFENSEVRWARNIDFYPAWRKLRYLPGCLGSRAIAREQHSGKLVVCDGLKRKIEKAAPRSAFFVKPEDFESPLVY